MSHLPGAIIHYTRDGSAPTLSSPVFDSYRLIAMAEFGQPDPTGKSVFTIRAIAAVGERASEVRIFTYELNPRGRDVYLSQEVAPGVRMIRDFENDKMYLVTGSQRALLIDAGMGSGDLRRHIESQSGTLSACLSARHRLSCPYSTIADNVYYAKIVKAVLRLRKTYQNYHPLWKRMMEKLLRHGISSH